MPTPREVLIPGEHHLIIHGQFGNLRAKINQLEHMLKVGNGGVFLPYLAEIEYELEFLKEIYPAIEGGVNPVNLQSGTEAKTPILPGAIGWKAKRKIQNALQDMRVLMDAAALSFRHEGNIDCHLKVMLDEAWVRAAAQVELDAVDDLPF